MSEPSILGVMHASAMVSRATCPVCKSDPYSVEAPSMSKRLHHAETQELLSIVLDGLKNCYGGATMDDRLEWESRAREVVQRYNPMLRREELTDARS